MPPLFAGTVQCTPNYYYNSSGQNENASCDKHCCRNVHMKGGKFAVNLDGWDHYDRFGYKGCKKNDIMGGLNTLSSSSEDREKISIHEDTKWVIIPYKFNRGILHTGHLPHLSTTVEGFYCCCNEKDGNGCEFDISPATITREKHEMKRVIMGFNVFANDIGDLVAKVPEHSESFRRWVKWYRTVVLKTNNVQTSSLNYDPTNTKNNQSSAVVKLHELRKNKPLMKLLVLAKREKIKKEWANCRQAMTIFLINYLLLHGKNYQAGKSLPLEEIASCWIENNETPEANIIPTQDDFLVHIEHLSKLQYVYEANTKCNYQFYVVVIDGVKSICLNQVDV